MNYFSYMSLRSPIWDMDTVSIIAAIYKNAGKQGLYLKQKPHDFDRLIEITKQRSIQASNAIENIKTDETRIKLLVDGKVEPKNRNEQEILGYSDALDTIYKSIDMETITVEFILQLHEQLFGHTDETHAGQLKTEQNYINAVYPDGREKTILVALSPNDTSEALKQICAEFNYVVGTDEVEPLIAIAAFIHDFLCIHPFDDGNGRISRLLTTLLLCRSGFCVGKYVSLESKILKNREGYYQALSDSQASWNGGGEGKVPFVKYLLGTIRMAYDDFETRLSLIEEKQTAINVVRKAIQDRPEVNKQLIRDMCPSLSVSSIEGSLRVLVKDGTLEKNGKGRTTYYTNRGLVDI